MKGKQREHAKENGDYSCVIEKVYRCWGKKNPIDCLPCNAVVVFLKCISKTLFLPVGLVFHLEGKKCVCHSWRPEVEFKRFNLMGG